MPRPDNPTAQVDLRKQPAGLVFLVFVFVCHATPLALLRHWHDPTCHSAPGCDLPGSTGFGTDPRRCDRVVWSGWSGSGPGATGTRPSQSEHACSSSLLQTSHLHCLPKRLRLVLLAAPHCRLVPHVAAVHRGEGEGARYGFYLAFPELPVARSRPQNCLSPISLLLPVRLSLSVRGFPLTAGGRIRPARPTSVCRRSCRLGLSGGSRAPPGSHP